MRFEVINLINGKYAVQDTATGKFVRFGFNSPPLVVEPGKPATEWNNWYSARDFAKRLAAIQTGNPAKQYVDVCVDLGRYDLLED